MVILTIYLAKYRYIFLDTLYKNVQCGESKKNLNEELNIYLLEIIIILNSPCIIKLPFLKW